MTPSELEKSKQRVKDIEDSLQDGMGGTENLGTSDKMCSIEKKGTENNVIVSSDTSPLAEELRSKIDEFSRQLNNAHLSEAKKYALKKSLAMEKAKLIREERRLKLKNS